MKQRDYQAIESFVLNFEHLVKELENYSDYLSLGDETTELKEEALEILKKKVKKMKKGLRDEDKDKINKVVRVNKILEKSGVNEKAPRIRLKP